MKKNVLNELKSALAFLGQAQEAAPKNSALWKELGKAYDTLDSISDTVEDYNDDGEL